MLPILGVDGVEYILKITVREARLKCGIIGQDGTRNGEERTG